MANILIIEDNLMDSEIAGELLKKNGHKVIKAENGSDGIRLAKIKSPDLILMDLNLPQMDGLNTTKILKHDPLTKNIPVIALTALVMAEDREKACGAGCSGFIPKPIDVPSFAATVEKYLPKIEYFEREPETREEDTLLSISHQDIIEKTTSSKYSWHKILIVDDNPMNADLLKDILEQIGQSSDIAYSGKQALDIIEKEKFDLILLDVMMPEMSGFEVIERLKVNPKTKEIPVIFISALNETGDIVKGLDLGSYGYITKPYNIEELKAKILSALRVKDLQDQLRIEKSKLDLIYKFTNDAIIILNSSYEVVSCNDQCLKWVQKSKEDTIGKELCSILNCEYTEKDDCPIYNAFFTENLDNITREMNAEIDGQIKTFQVNSSKINNSNGETEGYILIVRDVTVLKEVEKQKETFVATLTHDLKTPIRAETRALELLLKGNFGELLPEQTNIIQDMLQSSKYMFNMVDNLLTTYKYENGNVLLNKENTDLNRLIKDCKAELKYIIEDKKQDIKLDFQQAELVAFIDPIEIKRVIMNLFSNAITYTQEMGKITVKTEKDEDYIKVSFADNGKGISKEDISNLFNKYLSYAKKFRQIGTGLGLFLSKQIIESHDGYIQVESKEGKGSIFTFAIPIHTSV